VQLGFAKAWYCILVVIPGVLGTPLVSLNFVVYEVNPNVVSAVWRPPKSPK
jgi:hypothetical protein